MDNRPCKFLIPNTTWFHGTTLEHYWDGGQLYFAVDHATPEGRKVSVVKAENIRFLD